MSEISPPNSPMEDKGYQNAHRQSRTTTPSTASTFNSAGRSIPADEPERSNIIDTLRVSAAARRSSREIDGDDGSRGQGNETSASVVASGEGVKVERWAEESIPAKDREENESMLTVNPLVTGGTAAGMGGGSSPGGVSVVSPSSIGLQLQPLSNSEGFPTEELGPASMEEDGNRWEDEEQAKSCTFQ